MASLYLYFHLLHSILHLKCNVYTMLLCMHVPDFEIIVIMGLSFILCFKAEQQDCHKMSMETKL